jgi:hypothetical protein
MANFCRLFIATCWLAAVFGYRRASADTIVVAMNVTGKVVGVTPQGRVRLNIGLDDGLKVGMDLEVLQGKQVIARVAILRAAPDAAIAEIKGATTRLKVQQGDTVRTQR